jgi:hypothetical protein
MVDRIFSNKRLYPRNMKELRREKNGGVGVWGVLICENL